MSEPSNYTENFSVNWLFLVCDSVVLNVLVVIFTEVPLFSVQRDLRHFLVV